MARYFFDIHSQGQFARDCEGSECDSLEAVRAEAMQTLPEIARDVIFKEGDRQAFTVLVRDENDATIYTATLTFAGLWIGIEPIPEKTVGEAIWRRQTISQT